MNALRMFIHLNTKNIHSQDENQSIRLVLLLNEDEKEEGNFLMAQEMRINYYNVCLCVVCLQQVLRIAMHIANG